MSLCCVCVCREEIERVNFRLKRESIKSYRYQAFSERFVEHIQTQDRKTGKVSLSGETCSHRPLLVTRV